jgi:hypothetical protein
MAVVFLMFVMIYDVKLHPNTTVVNALLAACNKVSVNEADFAVKQGRAFARRKFIGEYGARACRQDSLPGK